MTKPDLLPQKRTSHAPSFATVTLALVMPETLTLGAAVEDAFILVNDFPPPPEVVASLEGKRIQMIWTESTGHERPADAVRAMIEDMATKPQFRELLRAPGIQAQKRALYQGTHYTTPAPVPAPSSPAPRALLPRYIPTSQLVPAIAELARARVINVPTGVSFMPPDPALDAPIIGTHEPAPEARCASLLKSLAGVSGDGEEAPWRGGPDNG